MLPGDVRSISRQVLCWMNPEQGWQLRRITAQGRKFSDQSVSSEILEQFLTDNTLSADLLSIRFIFHLRATNPPVLYERRGLTRRLVFVPQKMFSEVVDKAIDVSSLLSTKGPIISITKLPYNTGILREAEPDLTYDKYYFMSALVCLNASRSFPDMEGMRPEDGDWPNIFLELRVGNTHSTITAKIEELKSSLEKIEAIKLLEEQKNNPF